MRVTIEDIRHAFLDLLSEKRSREEVADWAITLTQSNDVTPLEYGPPGAKREIWDALGYLAGVDLKDEPQSYLHPLDDIRAYWHHMQATLDDRFRPKT